MSISGWMRDEITIKRETSSQDSEGVAVKTWTVAARPTAYPAIGVFCRIQALPPKDAHELGITTDIRSWKIYFDAEPYIDKRDHVFLTDTDGVESECDVVVAAFSFDSLQARLWKCIVKKWEPWA